ncbi:uncharacterized protein J3D65DRAFT_667423 [Phyllosticta citribraziliensis]|uniref:Uncharacterized protein n=1 Tax=Phyllosticta citribraziliensis TaxID=989973 RepID=A0ABR1LUB1_9PEZI
MRNEYSPFPGDHGTKSSSSSSSQTSSNLPLYPNSGRTQPDNASRWTNLGRLLIANSSAMLPTQLHRQANNDLTYLRDSLNAWDIPLDSKARLYAIIKHFSSKRGRFSRVRTKLVRAARWPALVEHLLADMRLLAALFYNPAIQGGVGVVFDGAESPRERSRRDVVAFAASIFTCFDNAMREYSLTRSALLRAKLAAKLDGLGLRRRRRGGGGRGGGADWEATPRTYHFCFSDDSLSQQSTANSTDPAPLFDHHREGLFAEDGADYANYTPEYVYRGAGGRGYRNEIETLTETSVATEIPEIPEEQLVPARRTYDLSLSLRRRPNGPRRIRDIVGGLWD